MNAQTKGTEERLIIITSCIDLIGKLIFWPNYFWLDIMFLNETYTFHKKW